MNDVMKQLLELEEQFGMYDLKAMDVSYWILLRRWIYRDVLEKKNDLIGTDAIKLKYSRSEKMKTSAGLIWNSFFRRYPVPKKVEVLVSSHPRRVLKDHVYICTYTSPLMERLEDSLLLERPDPYTHAAPIPEKHYLYVDRCMLMSNLYVKYMKTLRKGSYQKLERQIEGQISSFIAKCSETFQVALELKNYAAEISRHILLYRSKRKYYEKLLLKYRPRVILEVVSYLPENLILNELGKKYGIPTIELQHSVINSSHIGYCLGNFKTPQLPDHLFVFSEYWKQLAPPGIDKEQIKVVGYPYFEAERKKYQRMIETKRKKKAVCFLSQWTNSAQLSKLAVELRRLLDEDWMIYYKLHPGEAKDWEPKFPHLLQKGIEVVDLNGMNLYELFSCCSFQVGVETTAIYEGFGFGLRTFIYNLPAAEIFTELRDMGYVSFVDDAGELKEKLEVAVKETQKDTLAFWKEDSLDCMLREIGEIKKQKKK